MTLKNVNDIWGDKLLTTSVIIMWYVGIIVLPHKINLKTALALIDTWYFYNLVIWISLKRPYLVGQVHLEWDSSLEVLFQFSNCAIISYRGLSYQPLTPFKCIIFYMIMLTSLFRCEAYRSFSLSVGFLFFISNSTKMNN